MYYQNFNINYSAFSFLFKYWLSTKSVTYRVISNSKFKKKKSKQLILKFNVRYGFYSEYVLTIYIQRDVLAFDFITYNTLKSSQLNVLRLKTKLFEK